MVGDVFLWPRSNGTSTCAQVSQPDGVHCVCAFGWVTISWRNQRVRVHSIHDFGLAICCSLTHACHAVPYYALYPKQLRNQTMVSNPLILKQALHCKDTVKNQWGKWEYKSSNNNGFSLGWSFHGRVCIVDDRFLSPSSFPIQLELPLMITRWNVVACLFSTNRLSW